MPDPSRQAVQQAQQAQQAHQNHVRHHRETHDLARAHARHSGTPHRPMSHGSVRVGGLRGLLALIIIVAIVVYLAHDPELRTMVGNFARNVLSKVQSNQTDLVGAP